MRSNDKKVLKEKKQQQPIQDTERKDYDTVDKAGWLSKWRARNQKRAYLIRMELRNGNCEDFVVTPKGNDFVFEKERYVIDPSIKFWVNQSRMYALDYMQGFALPIRRKYDVNELNAAIEGAGMIETELSTNPKVLEDYVNSKIAEGVMKAQQIDEWMKATKQWIQVTAIVVGIHLLLFAYKTGMLNQIVSIGKGG